ncbi:hypothetical protein ACS0TY_028578 [Phlomoides rotata]
MTCRSVRPKTLSKLRRLKSGARHSATATDSAAASASVKQAPNLPEKPDRTTVKPPVTPSHPAIDFTDSKKLYSSLSTGKLLTTLITLKATTVGPVANLGSKTLNSRLIMGVPIFRHLLLGLTERTFYDHFCAGKDIAAADAAAKKLWDSGLTAMLDYGLECANENESCDRNTEGFIRTIESTKLGDNCKQVSFVVVKISAICPSRILRRVSDLLRWEFKISSMNLPWKLKSLPILCDSSALYHTMKQPAPLTPEEERDLELVYDRLFRICQKSVDANKPLLIDAEETTIQPAIDYLTYAAVVKFRSDPGQPPRIFNTVQAYLVDAADRLALTMEAAEKMGIPLGIKLVRGAYMNFEKKEAARTCSASPIHFSIGQTHECYDRCTDFLLEKMVKGSASAVLATHNIQSGTSQNPGSVPRLDPDRDMPCTNNCFCFCF